MKLGSHNAWTFLTPQKWWMKLLAFTARCQEKDIKEQYALGSRFFDLRVKFPDNKFTIAHGIIKYNYSKDELMYDLDWLNKQSEKVYIRVVHEIRKVSQIDLVELMLFRQFCREIEYRFTNIYIHGGSNLLPKKRRGFDYVFNQIGPSCEELYSSVTSPRLIDDWFPKVYAKLNNKKNIQKGTDKEILLIDFVNIK